MKKLTNPKAEAYCQNAKILFQQGNHKEAIKECNRSIDLDPNAPAHVLLGENYFWENKINAAIKEYNYAIMLDLNHVPAYNHLAVCMVLKGDLQKADNFLQCALNKEASKQDHSETYFVLAFILQIQSKLQEAVKYFKKAQDLNPNHQATKKMIQVISG